MFRSLQYGAANPQKSKHHTVFALPVNIRAHQRDLVSEQKSNAEKLGTDALLTGENVTIECLLDPPLDGEPLLAENFIVNHKIEFDRTPPASY